MASNCADQVYECIKKLMSIHVLRKVRAHLPITQLFVLYSLLVINNYCVVSGTYAINNNNNMKFI